MGNIQSKNWWDRNWKWFVPVACLASLVVLIGFIALIMSFVFGAMKSSDAFKQALTMAKSNPKIESVLGSPIQEGYFITGSIKVYGASGDAQMAIPISGPKGSGTIYLEATKSAGEWSYSKLVVQIEQTNELIDILDVQTPNTAKIYLNIGDRKP